MFFSSQLYWYSLSLSLSLSFSLCYSSFFRLLNGADPVLVGLDDDHGESLAFANSVFDDQPAGHTPLCDHLKCIVAAISAMATELRAAGKKAAVIICTDGESTDGDMTAALRPLEKLPVWVVIRLCTDDDKVVSYWNDIDTKLELEIDVLDDLCSECLEVSKLK